MTMSSEGPHRNKSGESHGNESDEQDINEEESDTENDDGPKQDLKLFKYIFGGFISILLVSFMIIIWVQFDVDPLSYLNNPYGPLVAGVGGTLLGSSLTGIWLRNTHQRSKEKIDNIESKIDQLAAITSTGNRVDATHKKLDLLISAAKNGDLGGKSRSGTVKKDGSSKNKDYSISTVLRQMGSHRLPPEGTPARELISQIQTYKPKNRGSLKDTVEALKDQAEDIQLLEETLSSTNGNISPSRDPKNNEFTKSLEALDTAYNSLNTSPSDRAPTLVREHCKNLIKHHKATVQNFQSYFDRQQTDESTINLQAASQIESDSTVNLPPRSTAKNLIDDLQNQEDGNQVKHRLRQAVDKMNSYRSVRSSLETKEELRSELNSLSESTHTLQGPVADILQQEINAVEQLFSRASLDQMDDVQRISLQERISVLTDIVAEMNQIRRYQDEPLSEDLESLKDEIDGFISRYIDNREWNHYNHSISNQYVSLAQTFHENASEAAGQDDTRAKAFIEAGQQTLDITEQLYQKPKFTSLLDPTID